jgi:hypothetical protein
MSRQPLGDGRYDSVSEFIADASADAVNSENQPLVRQFIEERRGEWYGAGCRTGADVDHLVNTGWQEGRKKTDAFLAKLESIELAPRDMRRRVHRTDFGDHLDIGDVYAGRIQTAWTVARRKTGFGPQRIDLCANMICYGIEDADVLFWRGAAAVALCDKLENAGYMVRLVVGFGDVGDRISCRVTVKDYGMPMDLLTASSVVLPGFFRAIGHRWICSHDPKRRSQGGLSVGQSLVDPGEIFLSHEIRSERTAKEQVEKIIRKIDATAIEAA